MKKGIRFIRAAMLAAASLICLISAAQTFVGDRADFRDETIYFVITTRFYDGDPSNNTYCWDGKLNVNDPEWRGDFKGLIKKLDYIKALGFTTIWITPVVENASGLDYHGYHAFNFSKVDPRYESNDCKFQDLITAAHARGMKVVLDIVLNHTGNFGEEHLCPMFVKDYSANQSNLAKSMKLHPATRLPENYFQLQGSVQHTARLSLMKNVDGINHDTRNFWHHVGNEWNWDDYSRWYGQIAGDCVDLNTENPAVSNYLVQCYGAFIAMGVDGFRIDTSGHISRLTFNKSFLPQFMAIAEQHRDKRGGGEFFIFGEVCARERNVTYRNHENCSPYFYTWKEEQDYPWDYSETSWDTQVVLEGQKGTHVNIASCDRQGMEYGDDRGMPESSNALLIGNSYHTPDHSRFSGLSVIDFPMHWNFRTAAEAFSVKYGDKYYNDATYNVVYVDSHDYAPDGAPEGQRFAGSQATWAENLSLMFTFRGIPCVYYGSEIEFKKGCEIDKGPYLALKNSGRAYFGGYMEGTVQVSDFAQYTSATGNMQASLGHPLSIHIQQLNRIRAAVPALRKGQYSVEGCSGTFAFKRRYTDAITDSYALVTISGPATFTGIENGTYTEIVTGQRVTVTNGSLSASCSGKGNLRVYVLNTAKTPAPTPIVSTGKYIYSTTPAAIPDPVYDGNQEPEDTQTVRDTSSGGAGPDEPATPTDPAMSKGEQAVFFENTNAWGGYINVYAWNTNGTKYCGNWPGEQMAYLGRGVWKWTYTGSGKVAGGVIFNNGSSQTQDLEWINGGYYTQAGYVKTIEGAGDIPDDPQPGTDPALYRYYFSGSWTTPYAYFWDAGNGNKEYLGKWPGTAMTPDGQQWVISFTTADHLASPMIIFNDGAGTQTPDFVAVNGAWYTTASVQQLSASSPALRAWSANGSLYIEASEACDATLTALDGTVSTLRLQAGINTLPSPARGVFLLRSGATVIKLLL